MKKVLVSDNLASEGLEVFRQASGIEVIEKPGLSPAELLELVADVDGLAIRSGTKVTADVIEAAKNLRVIGRAGIGVDNVDVPRAVGVQGVVRAARGARGHRVKTHGRDRQKCVFYISGSLTCIILNIGMNNMVPRD